MNKLLKLTFTFLLFCVAFMPCESLASSHILPNTLSYDFIMQMNGEVTFEQNDDDSYTVNHFDSCLMFGEDIFTEDNVLQHFIFNKIKAQNNNVSPNFENPFYIKAQ